MSSLHRREICRFEWDGLLYRTYFFEDGEIAFSVTGDTLRLGLITQEDLRWAWDWMTELPCVGETSKLVNTHSQPVRVLRNIALRVAQYVGKHRPLFFYYRVVNDARQMRIYDGLVRRHAGVAGLYELIRDPGEGGYVMFTLKAE